jgi:hypothetical protein
MHIDFDSFFRNRIEGLLIRASWVETLRSMLGLKGVSQIWNGDAAWYLWLQGAPGVYALVFSEGDDVVSNGHRLFEGHFALKCYPYAHDAGFAGFSDEERRWIQSDRFDATNTPKFDALAEIPEALFTVGSLSLVSDADDSLALLTYQSLDALRIYQSDQVAARADGAPVSGTARLVRNVAGWATGYPLFDCLVGLYTHSTRQPPAFCGVTRSRGFDYTFFADGQAECRPSRRTVQTAVTIGFQSSDRDIDRLETLWRDRLEKGEKIQAARRLPVSMDDAGAAGLPDSLALNPKWWEIAASDFKSELSSACGCSDNHCHHSSEYGCLHER